MIRSLERESLPVLVLTGLAVAAAAARPALAQEVDLEAPRHRQGYYAALGALGTVAHNREDGRGLGVWGGVATSLRLGQMISRRLGAGVVLDVGGAAGDGQVAQTYGVGLEAQVELAPSLALHGAVGLGVLSLESLEREDESLRGVYGAAYTVGLSYDWFLTGRRSGGWAATPVVQARLLPGDTASSLAAYVGVELTYWTGLPRSQLVLPESEAYGQRRR